MCRDEKNLWYIPFLSDTNLLIFLSIHDRGNSYPFSLNQTLAFERHCNENVFFSCSIRQ